MEKTLTPTLEEKARFFAQCKDAPLAVVSIPKNISYPNYPFDENESGLTLAGVIGNRIIVDQICSEVHDRFEQCALLLKPLSSITDEHKLEIAKILYYDIDFFGEGYAIEYVGKQLRLNIETGNWYYHVYQFLQSKGYALPFMNYSVDDLISFGWVKLSTPYSDLIK